MSLLKNIIMAKELKPLPVKSGSVLETKKEETVKAPEYTDKEKTYISNLQKRLESAKLAREQQFEEFDNLTLTQYYQANENAANTVLKPKKNKQDVVYQSGTLRTKMMSFVSTFQGLNLSPDISAFDKNERPINVLGNAMEDVISKTEELEGDEEQKMLRQYELLKQGTVFLEELWEQKWKVNKKISKGFFGMIKGVIWKTKRVLGIGQPRRRLLSLLSVYLGDIRIYDHEEQPYIFTVKIMNRIEAEQIYGSWERWQYVSENKQSFTGTVSEAMAANAWRLTGDVRKGQVEVIKYQDKPNNEFQIILNGVPMLPLGYPFPWKHGEYSIVQQNLEPIRFDFAYGKSFIFKNKNLVVILDEMMKLAVLKTQKSYAPPYLNLSGKVVSKTVFMPGKITRGIDANTLVPVSDKEVQGVTASEAGMVQEIIKTIDTNTASQTFTGSREKGQVTATQIVELQRQARIMMGILILAATLLEKKLSVKRLMILLENWFNPIDEVVNDARGILRKRYRIVSRMRTIEEAGPGVRMVVPTEAIPTSEQLMEIENKMAGEVGMPVRILVLSPSEIQSAKLTWVTTINPKEKRSSEMSKLMFGAEARDALELGLRLNPDWLEDRFAEVWEEDSSKMFMRGGAEGMAPAGQGEQPGAPAVPKIKAPRVPVEGGATPGRPAPATAGAAR